MDIYQIIEKPLVTEKGSDMLSSGNWVVFVCILRQIKFKSVMLSKKFLM